MLSKDYYKILKVVPGASQLEIKRAYRQLVMKYHPDKNEDNPFAATHFRQVQEAYQVLSDPGRRSAYNQQRWYRKTIHKTSAEEPFSPDKFLERCLKLSGYVNRLGDFRIDQEVLYQYMLRLLTDESIERLQELNDAVTNTHIMGELLVAGRPLSYRYLKRLEKRLIRVAGKDIAMIRTITHHIRQRKWLTLWQKYQVLVILLATVLFCWLMYKTMH